MEWKEKRERDTRIASIVSLEGRSGSDRLGKAWKGLKELKARLVEEFSDSATRGSERRVLFRLLRCV